MVFLFVLLSFALALGLSNLALKLVFLLVDWAQPMPENSEKAFEFAVAPAQSGKLG